MLSPAEPDFARRDSAVPGLTIALDPDACVAALRGAAPQADIRMAQITYVRYKPQTYCRVAYRLNVAGADVDVDVRACRPEDLAQWREDRERVCVSGPLGPGRIVLADCALLISVFPNDLGLPVLQHLTDTVERKRLLHELLP